MRAVCVTDRSSARELLPKGDEQEVLVLRNGRAVALVTPFDDEDAEWYARERDPDFIKSIQRARQQVKRGETVSHEDLERLLADAIDGIDLDGFSSPVSVETLRRTKCAGVPTGPGVYVVLRPTLQTPQFLKKSVGGWFKGRDPSDPVDFLKANWVDDATILYVGEGNGRKGLKQRLWQFIQFGMGKSIGHRGGRLIWHLKNHRQLLVRWKLTPKENPENVETRMIQQFRSAHGVRPFANVHK